MKAEKEALFSSVTLYSKYFQQLLEGVKAQETIVIADLIGNDKSTAKISQICTYSYCLKKKEQLH